MARVGGHPGLMAAAAAPQQGLAGAAAAQPALGPGREIHRLEQRQLPDGRVIEFVYVLRTYATADRNYITWELARGPVLDCSCAALSIADVFCCSACTLLVCTRHAATCSGCGRVYCSACLVGVRVHGVRAIVCGACARSLRAPWLVRTARTLGNWLWG